MKRAKKGTLFIPCINARGFQAILGVMGRRILGIVLLVVAISIVVMTPVLAFTPVGGNLLSRLAGATPTATPSPTPLPPTPTPTPPRPIFMVVGTPPPRQVGAAYLFYIDIGHKLVDFFY